MDIIMIIKNMTEQERSKLYRKLYNKIRKNASGGLTFGLDWTTLAMQYPQIYSVMRQIAIIDNY